MAYNFSNDRAENAQAKQMPASGIDRETVHRIRQQGRIERAKIVRRCFAMLRRAVVRRGDVTADICHGSS